MASEVEIANSALLKVGAKQRITSLTQNTANAVLVNEQYPKVRDDLLRSHTWNFARKWSSLATTGTTPVAEFDYEFTLPSDFIRVVRVSDNDAGVGDLVYDIYQGKLYADSNTVYLLYVYKETDPNLMPPDFREALAWALAYDISYPMTDSNNVRETLERGMRRAIARAKTVDAQENYPDPIPAGSWVSGRFGTGSEWWGRGST